MNKGVIIKNWSGNINNSVKLNRGIAQNKLGPNIKPKIAFWMLSKS